MKRKITWLGLSILIVIAMLLASCSTSTTTSTQTSMPTTTVTGPVVLTVTSGSQIKTYSLTDLHNMSVVSGYGGQKDKGGIITGPFPYQGVALTDLLNAVGGITAGQSVKITGSDGYIETLSYNQITNGTFNIYDTSGNQITTRTIPTIAMVYSVKGTSLDSTTGPVEFGILYNLNFITDESIWVKMVNKIDIISAQ